MAATKELQRNPDNGMIAGVCAGIADYLELDTTLVRVVTVLIAFVSSGVGILIYFVLALIMPSKGTNRKPGQSVDFSDSIQAVASDVRDNVSGSQLRNYAGLALIAFGSLLLLERFAPVWMVRWDYLWPIVLILIGIAILSKRNH